MTEWKELTGDEVVEWTERLDKFLEPLSTRHRIFLLQGFLIWEQMSWHKQVEDLRRKRS